MHAACARGDSYTNIDAQISASCSSTAGPAVACASYETLDASTSFWVRMVLFYLFDVMGTAPNGSQPMGTSSQNRIDRGVPPRGLTEACELQQKWSNWASRTL